MTLTLLWALPLIGALAAWASPGPRGKQVALGFALVTLVDGIVAALQFHLHRSGFQLSESHWWIKPFGVHYAVGVDGLGLLMVLLTVVLTPIVMLAAWHERRGSFFALALALEGFALAVFVATDVFLFYVVFEATLIPAYFLIGWFGRGRRADAALKFLMYQLGGGLVLLIGVIGLFVVQHGQHSYLISDLQHVHMSRTAQRWIFVSFFAAFAVKAPLFPVHTWLADTTERASAPTSVLLVCVLDKIGTFGMLRFCLGLLPEASHWATPVVVTLALISIVYGAILAIGTDDLLRLIGLTSLSHFGLITLGIFVWSTTGASGAILYMVNHGVATAALFLVAGFLLRRRGTVRISELSGLERTAPVMAGLFLVAGLATLGLPGLSQFVSEIMVIISGFAYHWWVGAIAVTAIVLAALYILGPYQRIFTGPGFRARPTRTSTDGPSGEVRGAPATSLETTGDVTDLDRREIGVLAPLLVALLVFGFVPGPLLDLANPVSQSLVSAHGGSAR